MKLQIRGRSAVFVIFAIIALTSNAWAAYQYSPPSLTSPMNGDVIINGEEDFYFSVSNADGATWIWYWVDNHSGFGSPEIGYNNGVSADWIDDGVHGVLFNFSKALQGKLPENVYYIKACMLNASKQMISDWSSVRSFTLLNPDIPVQCRWDISPTSKFFGSVGGTGTISVDTNKDNCPWTASDNRSWITITSGTSGNGDGTVRYSVSENTDTSSRSGTITVAGKSFSLTQEGKPPVNDYTYSWETSSWGDCSVTCGSGIQSRTVLCRRSDGVHVDDRNCDGQKPIENRACEDNSGCTSPNAVIISINPSTAYVGQNVTFEGSGADPDGGSVGYSWISNIDGHLGTSATLTLNSLSLGTHAITLRVTDDEGATDTDTRQLVISQMPQHGPTTDFTADRTTAPAPALITFTCTSQPGESGEIEERTWAMGDGSDGYLTQRTGQIVKHVFSLPGTYQVKLTVKDDADLTNSKTMTITITGGVEFELPFPSGVGMAITCSYGCGFHNNDDRYCVDFATLYADYNSSAGIPILAVESGEVDFAGWVNGYGYRVVLKHDQIVPGLTSNYSHGASLLVRKGDQVRRGQELMVTWGTGGYTPHIHFGMRLDGVSMKPLTLSGYQDFYPIGTEKYISNNIPDNPFWIIEEDEAEKKGSFDGTASEKGHEAYHSWSEAVSGDATTTLTYRPNFSAQTTCTVLAYIPPIHATTTKAVYTIRHIGGTAQHTVNQNSFVEPSQSNPSNWAELGRYTFGAGDDYYVQISNATTDAKEGILVGFDAIMFDPRDQGGGLEPDPEVLYFGDFNQGYDGFTLWTDPSADVSISLDGDGGADGSQCLRIENRIATTHWYVQAKMVSFPIQSGQQYEVSFSMRSENAGMAYVQIQQDTSPWDDYGLWGEIASSQDWQDFSFVFTVLGSPETDEQSERLTFKVGGILGNIWIDNVMISGYVAPSNNSSSATAPTGSGGGGGGSNPSGGEGSGGGCFVTSIMRQ